jgi:hypothetical protein
MPAEGGWTDMTEAFLIQNKADSVMRDTDRAPLSIVYLRPRKKRHLA